MTDRECDYVTGCGLITDAEGSFIIIPCDKLSADEVAPWDE